MFPTACKPGQSRNLCQRPWIAKLKPCTTDEFGCEWTEDQDSITEVELSAIKKLILLLTYIFISRQSELFLVFEFVKFLNFIFLIQNRI